MKNSETKTGWIFKKEISFSTVIQLTTLTVLILGSWINLQKQIYIVQHDLSRLLEQNKNYTLKVEQLKEKSIALEYQLINHKCSIDEIMERMK